MCVIIEKLPGKEIPYEHLLAGAHRNSDGYGAVVVDRGKLEIIKGLSKDFKKGADEVQKLLEQAKDKLAYVHYRFRTKGDVDIENCHPFRVLKTANTELVFMHNGTVSEFSDTKLSDSRLLCEQVIAPLAKRSAALLGDEAVCCDPLVAQVLNHYAGGTYNKFVLVDNHGNSMIINRKTGADQPYGWASNAYSLDTSSVQKFLGKETQTSTVVGTFPGLPRSATSGITSSISNDNVVSLATRLKSGKATNKPSPRAYSPSIRQTVAEITGFDLKDFSFLDAQMVRQMVDDQPDLSAMLILDLLAALYEQDFKSIQAGA